MKTNVRSGIINSLYIAIVIMLIVGSCKKPDYISEDLKISHDKELKTPHYARLGHVQSNSNLVDSFMTDSVFKEMIILIKSMDFKEYITMEEQNYISQNTSIFISDEDAKNISFNKEKLRIVLSELDGLVDILDNKYAFSSLSQSELYNLCFDAILIDNSPFGSTTSDPPPKRDPEVECINLCFENSYLCASAAYAQLVTNLIVIGCSGSYLYGLGEVAAGTAFAWYLVQLMQCTNERELCIINCKNYT